MYSSEDWQKLVNAFKQWGESDSGEIVLNYLSYQCYENRNTFVESEAMSNRNIGKREVILLIREWMACDSRNIPKHLKEKFNA